MSIIFIKKSASSLINETMIPLKDRHNVKGIASDSMTEVLIFNLKLINDEKEHKIFLRSCAKWTKNPKPYPSYL